MNKWFVTFKIEMLLSIYRILVFYFLLFLAVSMISFFSFLFNGVTFIQFHMTDPDFVIEHNFTGFGLIGIN